MSFFTFGNGSVRSVYMGVLVRGTDTSPPPKTRAARRVPNPPSLSIPTYISVTYNLAREGITRGLTR